MMLANATPQQMQAIRSTLPDPMMGPNFAGMGQLQPGGADPRQVLAMLMAGKGAQQQQPQQQMLPPGVMGSGPRPVGMM